MVSSPTHSRSGFSPASLSGRTTFSSAVSIGRRLKNWKMKPMCSRRSLVSSESPRPRDVGAGDGDLTLARAVEPREDVHQRRLARARRAHHRGELPAFDVERDAAERIHAEVAVIAVAARDVPGGDQRARPVLPPLVLALLVLDQNRSHLASLLSQALVRRLRSLRTNLAAREAAQQPGNQSLRGAGFWCLGETGAGRVGTDAVAGVSSSSRRLLSSVPAPTDPCGRA